MTDEGLMMWTIYHRPADHPGSEYVIRRYWVTPGGSDTSSQMIAYAPDLETARRCIEREGGSINLGRSEQDAAVIVETWA